MRVDTFKYEGSKYGRLTAKWPGGSVYHCRISSYNVKHDRPKET
jgi:hypothetical protein